MALLVDRRYEELVCSECKKYLSVFPIKVYENGGVKCGRCTHEEDGGVVSLYEKLAKYCLFKCTNRYEGCRKLLLPGEVVVHEEVCAGKNYDCPSCVMDVQLSMLQLIDHLKCQHKNYFLTSNIFYLNLNENVNAKYFYTKDDTVFIILVKYNDASKCLYLSVATLYELDDVFHRFVISVDSILFREVTAKQNSMSLDKFDNNDYSKIDTSNILNQLVKVEVILDISATISVHPYEMYMCLKQSDQNTAIPKQCQTEPENSMFTIQLTPQFFQEYPRYKLTACGTALYSIIRDEQRIDLICSNCGQLRTGTYICSLKKHSVCSDCSEWCGLCNCAIDLSFTNSIMDYLLFPCKWKCGNHFNRNELLTHQNDCSMNVRKCPVCSKNFPMLVLKDHLLSVHQSEFVTISRLENFVSQKIKKVEDHYFIVNNNMFKMTWNKLIRQNKYDYDVHITPCDDMTKRELFIVKKGECHKLDNGKISLNCRQTWYRGINDFTYNDSTCFYLRHFH